MPRKKAGSCLLTEVLLFCLHSEKNNLCSLGLFLISLYFECISDKKRLCSFTWLKVHFCHKVFQPRVSVTSLLWLCGFFMLKQNVILTYTGNLDSPEMHTIAQCASEQSHENLHKVYWACSAGLRNCFWPKELTLMHKMHDRLIFHTSDGIPFCLPQLVIFQKKRSTLKYNSAFVIMLI